jgi:outer membrane lipase/esterase
MTRLNWNGLTAAALAALLLVACGGGDPDVPGTGEPSGAPTTPGEFTRVVSFGDSLSDVGTYAPATSLTGDGMAPYFGGRFTTNGAGATVWVENVATALGIVLTPAEVGFAGTSVACPAAANAALADSCTAYGQGGARVTDPNGIGHDGGALTVPMKTQIARHLERFGGFDAHDLVFVYGGNNDVFVQFAAFTATAAQVKANAAAGTITSDEANRQLLTAQLQAQEGMKQAAIELAGYVRDDILARGARYVAVVELNDIAETPFGQSLPAEVRPVLSGLSENFNLWLRDGLTGQPVQLIDAWTLFKGIDANPGDYGIANNTVPACDAAKIAVVTGGRVTDGSSLFCNATVGAPYYGLRDGADASTWFFADGVHPTTGGHHLIGDAFLAQLRAFGWI